MFLDWLDAIRYFLTETIGVLGEWVLSEGVSVLGIIVVSIISMMIVNMFVSRAKS